MKSLNWLKPKFSNKKFEIGLIPMEIRLTKKIDFLTGALTSDLEVTNKKMITDFTEREIIDFVYKENFHRLIHRELGFPNSENITVLKEQKEPFIEDTNKKPGDLDLILFDSDMPDRAMAIEIKCVKLTTLEDQTVTINKEKNLTKGITQANEYLKLGFYKTFLMVILLDDTWQQEKPNMIFKESSMEKGQRLLNPKVLENLNPNIGLMYLGIRQITPQSVYGNTKIDVKIIQDAIALQQDQRITNFLKCKIRTTKATFINK